MRPQKSQIEWRVNLTQVTREPMAAPFPAWIPTSMTRGEIEGRRQAGEGLCIPAHGAGLRELLHRRLCRRSSVSARPGACIGGYMLTGEDVLGCASFEDTIGVNGWPKDALRARAT